MKSQTLMWAVAAVLGLASAGPAWSSKTEGRVDVVTEGGIGKHWGAAPGASFAAPGYPAQFKERAANVCLSIGYTLNSETGTPSDLTLLQAWSRDKDDVALTDAELEPFVQSAAAALSQWRFVPKEGAPKHVTTLTSATMTFNGAPNTAPASLPGQCRITDLPAFVSEESKGRGRIDKALLDRLEIQNRNARDAAVQSRYTREE